VVAVGDCGCSGGIFGESYASLGGVGNVLPVDVAIPGCPPRPRALLQGILAAISANAGSPTAREGDDLASDASAEPPVNSPASS
jgi:Ni,Fe-hydrogenase III small subunit